jgi:hypothetical protein
LGFCKDAVRNDIRTNFGPPVAKESDMNSSELRLDAPRRVGWAISGIVLAVLAVSFLFGSFYIVDTGHVGVERTLGKVDLVESEPGMNFKLPLLTQAYEFRKSGVRAGL